MQWPWVRWQWNYMLHSLFKFSTQPENDGFPKGISFFQGSIFRWTTLDFGRVWLVFLLKTIQFMGVNPWESSPNRGIQDTKSSACATLKVSCISTPLMTFVRLLRIWRMKTQGDNGLKPTSTTMKGSSPARKAQGASRSINISVSKCSGFWVAHVYWIAEVCWYLHTTIC